MGKMPVGLQLYTVRDAAQGDFFGTLRAVKEMGYDFVEFIDNLYGRKIGEVRAELDRLGLKAVSVHVPIDSLTGDTFGKISEYMELDCEHIAIPWLDEGRRPGAPGWPAVLESIKAIGKACRATGITLLYHNHDFEFKKVDGEYLLDSLYRSVSDEYLQAEIDSCWVKYAGVDPARYVLKYTGRCPVLHLKDYKCAQDFEFCPVGQGVQDFPAILDAAGNAGVKYLIVEQDSSRTVQALEAARMSREYLKGLGY